jgi:hypothetical protein
MAMAVAARGPLSTIATRLRADTSSFFLQPQQPLQVPRRLQLPSLVCSYGRRSILSSVAITPSSRDAGGVLDAAARHVSSPSPPVLPVLILVPFFANRVSSLPFLQKKKKKNVITLLQ